MLAYVTDIEGMWDRLASFATGNPCVSVVDGHLRLTPGAQFLFGGDAVDRGPAGRRVVAELSALRAANPGDVWLLAGNRDINKLRLPRELTGSPPLRAPPGLERAALLRWIFANTMGAGGAFDFRRAELGAGASDDDVVDSFLEDLAPDGPHTAFLLQCRLAHRLGDTLFVHGGLAAESLFHVPGRPPAADVDEWIDALNAWYAEQLTRWQEAPRAAGTPAWAPLVAYQAPVPGTRANPGSVVYGRNADAWNNPLLPAPSVVAALRAAGVHRVVVGHTPSGDTPSILRDDGFEWIVADGSYSRVRDGARLWLDGELTAVAGLTRLDDGRELQLSFRASRTADTPVGRRTADGFLVKGQLETGDWLLYRAEEGYRVSQRAAATADVVYGRPGGG